MKAVIYSEYGPPEVLGLAEVPKPTPQGDEVLVKVRAASVNAADWRMVSADPFLVRFYSGLFRPNKITCLGADVAGVVEAVGGEVTQFKPGDEVFGDVFESGMGGFAEYKCARERELVLKPTNVSFAEAAAVPLACMTALHALRDVGQVRAGERVLISGASGGVGSFAVQLAKHFGAEVTAVCSTKKVELARALGADHVIDYTREDFMRSGKQYDLIVAVNGYRSIFEYRRTLTPNGRYAMVGGGSAQLFQALLLGPMLSLLGGRKMLAVSSRPNQQDMLLIKSLLESGQIKPHIDRCYPLSEVPEAVRHVMQGHASGKVVITLSQAGLGQ